MKKIFIGFVIFASMAMITFADDYFSLSSVGFVDAKIDYLYIEDNYYHYVKLKKDTIEEQAGEVTILSGTDDKGYLLIDFSSSHYKDLLAALLLAQSLDYRVRFRLDQSSPSADYNKVSYILMPY